jgi:hypothetical protein
MYQNGAVKTATASLTLTDKENLINMWKANQPLPTVTSPNQRILRKNGPA